jgi:hypothetical protein
MQKNPELSRKISQIEGFEELMGPLFLPKEAALGDLRYASRSK